MAAGVVGTTRWRNPRIDVGLRRFPKERATYLSGAHSHTGRLPRRTTETVNSIRVLPMPADLAWALLRVQDRQAQLRERLGSQWPNSNMVVLGKDGQPPNPSTLTSTWKKTLRDAGLPHTRLHDARHSCATLMHLNGVPAVVIAAWLGHADPGFTLRTYTHSNPAALAEAAKFLDSVTQLIPSSEPDSVA